ncbi:hypothetical protein IL306_003505 [Fusarium sp. DS 682]|nr:hypothetical protein IL306_003505 [Fusarium sp. DS 682]
MLAASSQAPSDLANTITSLVLLPIPKSWDISSFELAALEKFYRDTLRIADGYLDAVLRELDKKPDFHHTKKLYAVLDRMRYNLSKEDITRLREYFNENQCITLSEDDSERYYLSDCIWAPMLNCSKNACRSLKEFEGLFVVTLRISKTDIGRIYDELVTFGFRVMANLSTSREEQAIRLLVALSQEIEQYGRYLDKEKLLKSDIFPVLGLDERVMLRPTSWAFFIIDREALQNEG